MPIEIASGCLGVDACKGWPKGLLFSDFHEDTERTCLKGPDCRCFLFFILTFLSTSALKRPSSESDMSINV